MGNLYTNFTIPGCDVEAVLAAARQLRRSAYVVQASGSSVLFDMDCDEQDVRAIEALGLALSAVLSAPVLASMNYDDDHLLLWIFADGKCRAFYRSFLDAPSFAWSLCRMRGGILAYPLITAVLGWPIVLFQWIRHRMLVRLLSLPGAAVSCGYRYLDRGEIPDGHTPDEIKKA